MDDEALKLAICGTCPATLKTYADKCRASLSDICPGFMTIESAKAAFAQQNPLGRKGVKS